MTSGSRGWFVVFVLLVLLCGGLAGVVLDRAWLLRRTPPVLGGGTAIGAGPASRGGPRPVLIERQVALFARQLDLTAEQQQALADVLEAWNARAGVRQAEARAQFVADQQALAADIEALLTADQAERFRGTPAGRLLFAGRGSGNPGARGGRGGDQGGRAGPGRE